MQSEISRLIDCKVCNTYWTVNFKACENPDLIFIRRDCEVVSDGVLFFSEFLVH